MSGLFRESAAPQAAVYEVTAVRYAAKSSPKSGLYHRYAAYGEPDVEVEMAYYFWLLRSAERTVLVDCGFDPAVAARRNRSWLIEPVAALGALGIAPEDVATIVVTHCHYDHVGNLGAFPDAELILPRRELDFWSGPLASRPEFAAHVERSEIETILAAVAAGRVRTTEGEEEILPGVLAIDVGGHSPGQQLTVVNGADGPVVLTSDAVHFYEELELDRPFGVLVDLVAMYRAYDTINEMAQEQGATIVPGHDPGVMNRFPADGEGGIAVRVS